jgi:nitrogen fixation/metabolism regulation signal transduction histidine kinase
MSSPMLSLRFDSPRLCEALNELDATALDGLPFGVMGFDSEGHVSCYNNHEAVASGFSPESVLGQHLFIELAPCLNEVVPYVLTFRMRPTRARLRLLARPGHALRYVLTLRQQGGEA